MKSSHSILLISGSLRNNSTNTALLRTAQLIMLPTYPAIFYQSVERLPHFNPDLDARLLPDAVTELRTVIRNSDAVLFCTPEYAGALPGSFKNVLEWAVGDDHSGSLNGKPVAWINVSQRGAHDAHESLRKVLGYVGAVIIESACANIPVSRGDVGSDGLIESTHIRTKISSTLAELVKNLRSPSEPNRDPATG